MQQSSEVIGCNERHLELERSRYFLLQIIRYRINEYPLRDRAIFELTFYSPISSSQLISLNAADVDDVTRTVSIKRGNETLCIPITDRCATLLKELCSSANQSDTPLFLNANGERLSLSNLWFIKRHFSIETDLYP